MKILYIDLSWLAKATSGEYDGLTKSLCTTYKHHVKVIYGDVKRSSCREEILSDLRYSYNVTIQHIPMGPKYETGANSIIAVGLTNSINSGQISKELVILSNDPTWNMLRTICLEKDVTIKLIS